MLSHELMRNVVEVITREELEERLKGTPKGYVGIEPSGRVHLGTGLIIGNKVKDLMNAGVDMLVYLADWHAYINDKFGGDMEKIRLAGEYLKGVLGALDIHPRYLWADELVGEKNYWEKVIRIAKKTSLKRVKRAMTIMGRKEDEAELDSSKIIYPFMQVADIYDMEIEVALGGMDQRHAHMLARDVAPKLGYVKPVAVHTVILAGLKGAGRMDPIEAKMSKSKEGSAIFVDDAEDKIRKKMKKAYCPPEVEGNPVLQIAKHILFAYYIDKLIIPRPEKWGGDLTISSYEELEKIYAAGELHPMDLKAAVAEELVKILKPVREYVDKNDDIPRKLGWTQ
ncbi:MAG: tyrosine--tRNA ligase [Euryarchaeota archaeon]|nr:tyrosine--tRNA ligase [Euryarchaeota archaeon]